MATRRRTSRETVPKVMTRSMKKLKKGEKTKGRVTGGSRRGVNVDRGDRYDSGDREKNSRREESRSAKTREGQY